MNEWVLRHAVFSASGVLEIEEISVGFFFFFLHSPTAIWSTLGISTEFSNITKLKIGNGTDTGKCQWLGVLEGNFFGSYSRATGLWH